MHHACIVAIAVKRVQSLSFCSEAGSLWDVMQNEQYALICFCFRCAWCMLWHANSSDALLVVIRVTLWMACMRAFCLHQSATPHFVSEMLQANPRERYRTWRARRAAKASAELIRCGAMRWMGVKLVEQTRQECACGAQTKMAAAFWFRALLQCTRHLILFDVIGLEELSNWDHSVPMWSDQRVAWSAGFLA